MPESSPKIWLDTLKERAEMLEPAEKAVFQSQIDSVDWPLVARLVDEHVHRHGHAEDSIDLDTLAPADFVPLPATAEELADEAEARAIGQKLLEEGKVGVLIVAGGQGTRLGFDGPKGTYPIGAVSGSSLFYFHARRVLAISRKYGRPLPLLVMTSPENDAATRAHFQENGYFGLLRDQVRFFAQGQLPAVDQATGEPLCSSPASLALSPDGHGGCLYALSRKDHDGQSALEWAEEFGVSTLFYFQVDNPLVQISDPAFLGLHARGQADVSFKVVSKQAPEERVGVVCSLPDGRKSVIEYSDLPARLAEARNADGSLKYRAGSIAVHVFETAFLRSLALGETRLPFHKANKKVAFWDFNQKAAVAPAQPNAVKFEAFIFDTLPMARRSVIVETDRRQEFEPLKNAEGPDSPATVRAAMSRLGADLLEEAGFKLPRQADGTPLHPVEIDPCFATTAEELRRKLKPGTAFTGEVLLREEA